MKILVDRKIIQRCFDKLGKTEGFDGYDVGWIYDRLQYILKSNPVESDGLTWTKAGDIDLNNDEITDNDRRWAEKGIEKHQASINAQLKQHKEAIIEILDMLVEHGRASQTGEDLICLRAYDLMNKLVENENTNR